MKKVVKFGGSSLASAEQFKKVGDIIRADEGRRYVVPSAPGKRNSADTKVTDMLYDCYRTAVAGRDFKKKLQNIKARYQEIIDGLNLSLDLSPEFEKIAENFAAAAGEDYAASRGEYLNGIVMANYLGYTYIDSAEVICFDENGNFLADKTDEVLSERLKDLDNAVVPGFYGAKPDGSVKTFSRGGSDITGSMQTQRCDFFRKSNRIQLFPLNCQCDQIRSVSCVSFPTWELPSFMRTPSSHSVRRESRSTC